MKLLAEHRPGDAVLSEEAHRGTASASTGTRPTGCGSSTRSTAPASSPSRPARTGRCTSPSGSGAGELVAGAVALPALGIDLRHRPAPRRTPVDGEAPAHRRLPHAPAGLRQALAEEIDAELVPMGSAGAKVMSVVRDVSDAYVHAGGQYEWDSAAPVAVARAAGLFTSRVDGSPLVYNQDDVSLPDLVVCRPELADDGARVRPRARHRLTLDLLRRRAPARAVASRPSPARAAGRTTVRPGVGVGDVAGDVAPLVGGDAQRVVGVDVAGQAVDDRLVLLLEGAEQAVPDDQDAAVVAVEVLRGWSRGAPGGATGC